MPGECPRCGSGNIKIMHTNYRDIITDVPPLPLSEAVTTRHEINACACNACRQRNIQPDTDLPSAGNYGHNVIARVVSNHVESMPFRRNAAAASGIGMSSTTQHNAPCWRVSGQACR